MLLCWELGLRYSGTDAGLLLVPLGIPRMHLLVLKCSHGPLVPGALGPNCSKCSSPSILNPDLFSCWSLK
jgi:hypothetical protein